MNKLIVIAVVALLAGCGSNSSDNRPEEYKYAVELCETHQGLSNWSVDQRGYLVDNKQPRELWATCNDGVIVDLKYAVPQPQWTRK
jgi:uncharacterized protein YceK